MRCLKVLILLLGVALSSACGGSVRTGEVHMVNGGSYGKGLFVVSPAVEDGTCAISVKAANGTKKIDCNTQYLVTCDVDIPKDKPFCQLVSEIGTEHESVYPKARRQP